MMNSILGILTAGCRGQIIKMERVREQSGAMRPAGVIMRINPVRSFPMGRNPVPDVTAIGTICDLYVFLLSFSTP